MIRQLLLAAAFSETFRAARRVRPHFNFNMGKNTPERKDHILDKVVVPVEK